MSIIAFPSASQAPKRLKCSECGVEVDAGCSCGAPYVPAAERVAEYDKENPGQSTRQAALDLGVDKETVRKARSRGDQSPPTTVTGRDGKQYPAKKDKNFEDDTFAPDEDVEEPRKVLTNVLDTIKESRAVAEAYRKILKRSPFDREAKKQISDEIESLIRKWKSVQSTLAAPPPPQSGAAA